jgi:CheY-like chemotaxis protein
MATPSKPQMVMRPVLVVEDDHELAELLREVLTYENCAVDVAGNGLEALDKLRTANYDAVVCDLMMPVMDGQTLYKETCDRLPYLADRFLFVTGQASARAGMSDFIFRTGNRLLEKPFEIDQLRAALRELLSR